MKYVPLKNQPNVSLSRSGSISPSLKMNDIGNPCISWLDQGSNINEVKYSFWDGLKWSFYGVPKVYVSSEDIVFSPNALVLDGAYPVISFARKIGAGSRLSMASYYGEWNFNDLDVNYEVGWIGITRVFNTLDSSSSSSGSSNVSNYYVVVYDSTNSQFNIYLVNVDGWTLLSSLSESVEDYQFLKIDICGRKIGIAYVYNGSVIKYNFFDIDTSVWSFPSAFQDLNYSLSYGDIIDMDMGGYEYGSPIIAFGWISRTITDSYVCSVLANDAGYEFPSNNVSPVVQSRSIDVQVSSDYIVNGYRKIAFCIDDQNLIRILATGSVSKYFRLISLGVIKYWLADVADVEGISNGIVPSYVRFVFSDTTKIVMAADSGSIYYFGESTSQDFPMSTPDMLLLNDLWVQRFTYVDGQISGFDISGTYDDKEAGILYDPQRPLLIASNRTIVVPTTTTTSTTSPTTTTTSTTSPTTTTTTTTLAPWVFTQRGSIGYWSGIACSSNGTKLAIIPHHGYINTSSDSGVTWTPRGDYAMGWYDTAVSSDGTKMLATLADTHAYFSTNSGVTWTFGATSFPSWGDAATMSSTGAKMFVSVQENNGVYISTDLGTFWTPTGYSGDAYDIDCSSDGTKLILSESSGGLYVSSDSGNTWTLKKDGYWGAVASSSDGIKLAASGSDDIYTSSDGGDTWVPCGTGLAWSHLACSADGIVLASAIYGGKIYISVDSGATWSPQESDRNWTGIALSDDGTKVFACVIGGYVYTGVRP